MKVLSENEIAQVSGAGLIGSAIGKIGLKTIGKSINNIENKLLSATIGKIPLIGSAIVSMLNDPFKAFSSNTTE